MNWYAPSVPLLTIACTAKFVDEEETDLPADTDRDGDGYDVPEDCDDTDASVNPGEIETCDSVDTNCSGDEDDATDASTWYADADGDRYGDADSTDIACEAPSGYLDDATDCDDADDTVHPGAAEVCENGIDDDCDGGAGCAPPSGSLSGADAKYTGEAATNYAGSSVSAAGDVNGDGFGDFLIGGYGNDDGGYNAGAAYLVLGSATPGDLELSAANAKYAGEESDYAGFDVSTAGDVNGDSFGDLLIGAFGNADAGYQAGAAYLVLGNATPGDVDLGTADAQYTGGKQSECAGISVSTAGDVNGDGFGDLLIGSRHYSDDDPFVGAAYLVLGSAAPSDLELAAADAEYTSVWPDNLLHISVSTAGDADGDGLGDLLIGASNSDRGGSSAGAAYLLLGDATPSSRSLATADAVYGGGFGDLLVGAPYSDDGGTWAGAVFLVLGSPTPGDLDLGAADAQYTGEVERAGVGHSVSTAGDVDADGFDDFLIDGMADAEGGAYAGAANLVLGSVTPGDRYLGAADALYTGEAEFDFAGSSVSTAGDVDADGLSDLLIGAPGNDDSGDSAGAAYLLLGSGF